MFSNIKMFKVIHVYTVIALSLFVSICPFTSVMSAYPTAWWPAEHRTTYIYIYVCVCDVMNPILGQLYLC